MSNKFLGTHDACHGSIMNDARHKSATMTAWYLDNAHATRTLYLQHGGVSPDNKVPSYKAVFVGDIETIENHFERMTIPSNSKTLSELSLFFAYDVLKLNREKFENNGYSVKGLVDLYTTYIAPKFVGSVFADEDTDLNDCLKLAMDNGMTVNGLPVVRDSMLTTIEALVTKKLNEEIQRRAVVATEPIIFTQKRPGDAVVVYPSPKKARRQEFIPSDFKTEFVKNVGNHAKQLELITESCKTVRDENLKLATGDRACRFFHHIKLIDYCVRNCCRSDHNLFLKSNSKNQRNLSTSTFICPKGVECKKHTDRKYSIK